MKTGTLHPAATLAVLAAAVAAVAYLYYVLDPSAPWAPKCFFKAATGYNCPGCGFQRALHAALHGNIAQAWHFNPFVFFAVPAAIFFMAVESGRKSWPVFHARCVHPAVITFILVSIIAWWILRNI